MKRIISTIFVLLIACCSLTATAQDIRRQTESKVFKQEPEEQIEISVTDNRITVTNAPPNSTLEIYNVVGIKVREIELKESNGEYVVNIAKGYYIVRISEIVRKIAIR
jgi:hypothetical protein